MATENIVSKKYRILSDVTNKVWDVISFFTKAKDVELANGKNLETTCGSITGITSSLTSTSTTTAASASAIKQLNDKIADLNSNLNNGKSLKLTSNSTTGDWTIPLGFKAKSIQCFFAQSGGAVQTIFYDEVTGTNEVWHMENTGSTRVALKSITTDSVILTINDSACCNVPCRIIAY